MSTPLIGNKYRISKKIGGGSFGEIFLGVGPNNEKVNIYINLSIRVCTYLTVYSFPHFL